jgi:hypothetical protein
MGLWRSFSNGILGVGGEIRFQRLAWKLLGSSDSCEIGFGGRVEHASLMQLFLTLILPSIGTGNSPLLPILISTESCEQASVVFHNLVPAPSPDLATRTTTTSPGLSNRSAMMGHGEWTESDLGVSVDHPAIEDS